MENTSMKLKVQLGSVGLCGSCRHGTIVESATGKFTVRCDWLAAQVPDPVASCSRFDDRRQPSLIEMRRTAWILQTDDARKAIGFVSNRQWRKSKEFREEPFLDDDGNW